MNSMLTPRSVRRSVIAMTLATGFTMFSVYAIWLNDGCDPWMPFISDTDVYPGTDLVFTMGFAISGILIIIGGWQVGNFRHNWMTTSGIEQKWVSINRFGMYSAIIAGLGLLMIADTPWDEHIYLHMIEAFLIFVGGILFIICLTLTTEPMAQIEPELEQLKKPRLMYSIIAVASASLMKLNYSRMVGTPPNFSHLNPYFSNVKQCTNLGYEAMAEAAIFEWIMVIFIGAGAFTMIKEIKILENTSEEE
ncbi:MAG TPA: hypothetical protein QGF70_06215 [Candidatus Thalassarchaeaceae archaeon]|nr:hypothetical protein [Candidatus Thalassarchaeaceae archaeon]HJL65166.1 hypothetical protein [Candidatus Thalassarchaeaceae archaeon]